MENLLNVALDYQKPWKFIVDVKRLSNIVRKDVKRLSNIVRKDLKRL